MFTDVIIGPEGKKHLEEKLSPVSLHRAVGTVATTQHHATPET
jgi:hypothetical protein